jgi:hypothetical protein
MMATALETRRPRPEPASRRVLLTCDDSDCGWTLSCADPAHRFPDINTALDCARRSGEVKAATIEIWQGGEYICCVPLRPLTGWVSGPSSDMPRLIPYPALTAAERYANRAAEVVFTRAGPILWAALIGAVVAASLGWRLL